MSSYSILPTAGWGSEPNPDEDKRQMQIRWEDTFFPNGTRSCYTCEKVRDTHSMKDWQEHGYTWKLCSECSGEGLHHDSSR